jgi:hypothetical protein
LELNRKFRVLNQTQSMHTFLRDRYASRALLIDLLLLASAVVFCASAFATDEVLARFGPKPQDVRYIIRLFSVLAFMLSVLSLRVGWKEKSATHKDAAQKMARALGTFRKHQEPDGTWPVTAWTDLDTVYSEAMNNSVPIPEKLFVKLKARHLRKVEVSRMLDSNPGCPVFVLRFILFCSSLKRIFGGPR